MKKTSFSLSAILVYIPAIILLFKGLEAAYNEYKRIRDAQNPEQKPETNTNAE